MVSHRRWLLLVALGALVVPVAAQDDAEEAGDGDKRFRFHGEVRFRGEVQSNYSTFNDNSGFFAPGVPIVFPDDTVEFFPYRVRLALEVEVTERLIGQVQFQVGDVAGLNSDQREVLFSNSDPVDLYTGFLHWNEIGGTGTSLRIGRQELLMGNGFLFGNEPYYNGISFDAARLYWSSDSVHVQLWWAKTNETFEQDADTDIFTFEVGGTADRGDDVSFYAHFMRDDEISGTDRLDVLVIGFRWTRDNGGSSHPIWNLELVWQDGRIGNTLDPITGITGDDTFVAAWGGEGMWGWNIHRGASDHKIYLHAYLTSGDHDRNDDESNDFLTLFQDVHPRLGKADIIQGTNVISLGLAYEASFGEKHAVGVDLMEFRIDRPRESETQLAFPAGDFTAGNGFIIPATAVSGVPGEDELGQEIDVWYDYYYSDNLSFNVLVAWFDPGEAIAQINVDPQTGVVGIDDPAYRVAVQARLRF